jgi:cytidine deaminase
VDDLLALARTMMVRAHAPYSKFQVGAAVRDEDGRLHGGCNVENSAYPQGWCAEASAIAALVGAGKRRVLECLVVGPGPELITPCGGCRQKLREFAGDDLKIHLCGPRGVERTVTLGELFPMSFGPHHLGKP